MSTKNKDQFVQAEIRIRATEYYIANIKTTTYKKTAEIFNVGESSVRLWVNVFRKGGASSIELKKRGNTPERKLNISQEKKIINAYRKILNEPYLTAGVRVLIRTQLNGILYAFLQLKLLSVTDFTNLIGKETITI